MRKRIATSPVHPLLWDVWVPSQYDPTVMSRVFTGTLADCLEYKSPD